MSEPQAPDRASPLTAGALLRQARQDRGLHLMALAASLKVPPARLEAMEGDRWGEMPDAAYARALAHTVSRALGIDPGPVLRSLPAASTPALESIDAGLDAPFRESSGGPTGRTGRLRWSVVALGLALALVVWWLLGAAPWEPPANGLGQATGPVQGPVLPEALPDATRPARTGTDPGQPLSSDPQTTAAAPASPIAAAPPMDAPVARAAADVAAAGSVGGGTRAPSAAMGLRLVATQASWVELRDATGQVRLSRVLGAGESVELPFSAPLALTVGNAAATAVWVNGRSIDLAGSTRENVARIELR